MFLTFYMSQMPQVEQCKPAEPREQCQGHGRQTGLIATEAMSEEDPDTGRHCRWQSLGQLQPRSLKCVRPKAMV